MAKVTLIKQSYKEARESGSFLEGFLNDEFARELELIGIVSGSSSKIPFTRDSIEEINEQMVESTEKLGAQYVFGVEYKEMAGNVHGGTIGYGDAYKRKVGRLKNPVDAKLYGSLPAE